VSNLKPRRPSDPRPNNRPYYQDPNCRTCGTPLVLSDLLDNPDMPLSEVWHDEWVCPNHRDQGIVVDRPQREVELIRGRGFEGTMSPEIMVLLNDPAPGQWSVRAHPRALAELDSIVDGAENPRG
jgi:hypothetical protein